MEELRVEKVSREEVGNINFTLADVRFRLVMTVIQSTVIY